MSSVVIMPCSWNKTLINLCLVHIHVRLQLMDERIHLKHTHQSPGSRCTFSVGHLLSRSGEILLEPKRRFIAQSLSCSPFHRLEMTEILLKGRKTLTHPSILSRTSINFLKMNKTHKMKHARSKHSDLPVHLRSQICVFAGRFYRASQK